MPLQSTLPSQELRIDTVAVAELLPVFLRLKVRVSIAIPSEVAEVAAKENDCPAETVELRAKSVVPVALETVTPPDEILMLSM